jgi:hypothetical protein
MFIHPAITKLENGPDAADDARGSAATEPANPFHVMAIDLEHFAGANATAFAGGLATTRLDPVGAASDNTLDCIAACGAMGTIGGAVVGAAIGGPVGVVPGAVEGGGYGATFGAFVCDNTWGTEPPGPDLDGAGGSSNDRMGGAGGASVEGGGEPPPAPDADDGGAVGGFSASSGAPESNAGKAGPSDNASRQPTDGSNESNMSGSTSSSVSSSSSESSSSNSSSDDDGRVGGSKGEGDMPSDDSYGYSVNPRLANFGMVSAVEIALAENLLNVSSKMTQSNVASLGPLGVGLRG